MFNLTLRKLNVNLTWHKIIFFTLCAQDFQEYKVALGVTNNTHSSGLHCDVTFIYTKWYTYGHSQGNLSKSKISCIDLLLIL